MLGAPVREPHYLNGMSVSYVNHSLFALLFLCLCLGCGWACSSQASLKKSKHAIAGSHRYATVSFHVVHRNSCSQRNSWGDQAQIKIFSKYLDHNIYMAIYKLGSNLFRHFVAKLLFKQPKLHPRPSCQSYRYSNCRLIAINGFRVKRKLPQVSEGRYISYQCERQAYPQFQ